MTGLQFAHLSVSFMGFCHPPQPSAYSSWHRDLKICCFFHTFWAFWLYTRCSCFSSCSDLCTRGVLEAVQTVSPRAPTALLSPVHAGLLQGTPAVQFLVISCKDLHGEEQDTYCVVLGQASQPQSRSREGKKVGGQLSLVFWY